MYLKAHSFSRALLSENCLLLEIDNVRSYFCAKCMEVMFIVYVLQSATKGAENKTAKDNLLSESNSVDLSNDDDDEATSKYNVGFLY